MTEDPIADAFAASSDASPLLDAWHGLQKSVREATVHLDHLEQLRGQALAADASERAEALEEIIEDLRASLSDAVRWPAGGVRPLFGSS
jgi:hypothetical protein